MSCLTFFNGLCLSECLHVVEGAELYLEEAFFIQSGISHSVPELPRPAALLCVPGEAPLFMAKSWLHFRQRSQGLAKCDCEGNIENSNTRLTWSTAGSVTAGADTSPAWRNVVFLPAVRNSHRLMMKLPMCEKWLISASSLRIVSVDQTTTCLSQSQFTGNHFVSLSLLMKCFAFMTIQG